MLSLEARKVKMSRILIKDTVEKIDQEVNISGWVNSRRDHGKIVFIDFRDFSGVVQTVFIPGSRAYEKVKNVRPEWVLSLKGKVNKRPEKMVNPDLKTGSVEIEAIDIEILNEAITSPFEIDKTTKNVDEELRLKYRYLDLRTERMADNIKLRSNFIEFVSNYLWQKDFKYIETPYLTKSTPEGAREYIVPSRLYPGEFYVLPQSPQQFKQLLMVAGFERYFQIARCFRDEDQRGDRQPEFTQLDIEMSFVNQEDIMNLVEDMMIKAIEKLLPNKKIQNKPFPKISYKDSMEKYKSDKPDLRNNKEDNNELAFCWIVDKPLFSYSKSENKYVSTHHPFTMPKSEDLDKLDTNPDEVLSYSYDLVLNGFEIAGGSIRIHKKEIQDKIFKILGVSEEEKERRFGHLLRAFDYGAPPHGGIAPGIDRVIAILAGEQVIREVMAFPKTGDAKDLTMGAPSEITDQQIKDVHICLAKEAAGKVIKGSETTIGE